jgi:hypothetical protein
MVALVGRDLEGWRYWDELSASGRASECRARRIRWRDLHLDGPGRETVAADGAGIAAAVARRDPDPLVSAQVPPNWVRSNRCRRMTGAEASIDGAPATADSPGGLTDTMGAVSAWARISDRVADPRPRSQSLRAPTLSKWTTKDTMPKRSARCRVDASDWSARTSPALRAIRDTVRCRWRRLAGSGIRGVGGTKSKRAPCMMPI